MTDKTRKLEVANAIVLIVKLTKVLLVMRTVRNSLSQTNLTMCTYQFPSCLKRGVIIRYIVLQATINYLF